MNSAQQKNPEYPKRVSPRADALIAELDAAQRRRLYDELKATPLQEWFDWLVSERKEIARYDSLTAAERQTRLRSAADISVQNSPGRLQHACVYIELWRARMQQRYFHLPPSGLPLDTPERHREMLLAALASYNDYSPDDLWPFEYPKGESANPFLRYQ